MENLFELFHEYLNMSQGLQLPAYSLEQIVKNKVELPGIAHPFLFFKRIRIRRLLPEPHLRDC